MPSCGLTAACGSSFDKPSVWMLKFVLSERDAVITAAAARDPRSSKAGLNDSFARMLCSIDSKRLTELALCGVQVGYFIHILG